MILDDKYYPYPNECVMERNIQAAKEGKRSFLFYQAWNRKSYQVPDGGNPMSYVYGSNLRYKNYDLWAEIINDTRYFHDDDGDVDIGVLSENWGPHKKGAYVVYPKIARNGHWVAVEETPGAQG